MFRMKSSSLSIATLFITLSSTFGMTAQAVVTNVESGQVVGIVAKCDGSYRADGLRPGRYEIVEGGPHHAVRKLSVAEGQDSHVDLAAEVKSQCSK